MIVSVGAQLKKQLESLEELSHFTEKETASFKSAASLSEQANQAVGKVTLAAQWLGDDLSILSSGMDPTTLHTFLSLLQEHKIKASY